MAPFELHRVDVNALVNAGLQFDIIATVDDAKQVGRVLLTQHYRSLGKYDDADPPRYHLTLADFWFHPVAVLRLLDCYEYQSDETADWDTSPTRDWTARLRQALLLRLPDEAKAKVRHGSLHVPAYTLQGPYVDTPWGISTLDQIPHLGIDTSETTTVRKGLRAQILTGQFHRPPGGLSVRVEEATILGIDDGELPPFAQVSAPSNEAPGVCLVLRAGEFIAIPADAPSGEHFIASGAYLHTGDWRWRDLIGHRLPIPLHDRTGP